MGLRAGKVRWGCFERQKKGRNEDMKIRHLQSPPYLWGLILHPQRGPETTGSTQCFVDCLPSSDQHTRH